MRPVFEFAPAWALDSRSLRRHQIYPHIRTPAADVDPLDDAGSDDEPGSPGQEYTRPPRPSAADLTDQFYVAGWEPRRELPALFPHRDGPRPGYCRSVQEKQSHDDKSAAAGAQKRLPLHRQHLAVVTTILHTSLLRGDWNRAGRAWGLLLRTVHGGKYLDVRAGARWGIGADILLRQGAEHDTEVEGMQVFSADAFQAAKDYYEQLILQYPYNKHAPDSVANAVDFYPALFGITIYEAVCKSATAVAELDASELDIYGDPNESRASSHNTAVAAIKRVEAHAAAQLATRLDSVLAGPPYDRHVQLLQLRGMTSMWLADLHAHLARLQVIDQDSDEIKVEPGTSDDARAAAIERVKARRHLNKAMNAGARLPDVLQAFLDDST